MFVKLTILTIFKLSAFIHIIISIDVKGTEGTEAYPEIIVSQKSSINKIIKPVDLIDGMLKIPENFEELHFECNSNYPTRWIFVPSPVITYRLNTDSYITFIHLLFTSNEI